MIPNQFGGRQPLLFFISPSYWGLKIHEQKTEQEWIDSIVNYMPGMDTCLIFRGR